MKKVLTAKIEDFIIENSQTLSTRKIAFECGISKDVVARFLKRNNISVSEVLRKKWKIEAMIGKTSFTNDEDEFIKSNYLEIPVKTIASILNRSGCGISGRLKALGLKIPQELADARKAKGMYRAGQIPSNKGKKQIEFMTADAIEKTKATRFKKGHIPNNSKDDREEVKRRDTSGRFYWMIKLPENRKLVFKHIWIWEKENGPVPKGYNIIFKNGNSLDCLYENLECISNAELMVKNSLHRFPEELRSLIQLKGALKRQINKLEKQK